MSTRWPTRRLKVETLSFQGDVLATDHVWGVRYGAGIRPEFDDTGNAEFIVRRPVTARADIRGYTPRVGQRLTDDFGEVWTITAVFRTDSDYGGGYTVDLEQDIAGAG